VQLEVAGAYSSRRADMPATFGDNPDTVLNKGGKEMSEVSHIGFAVPRCLT
jgi:hypothetical protein